jgi:hypothetical protein
VVNQEPQLVNVENREGGNFPKPSTNRGAKKAARKETNTRCSFYAIKKTFLQSLQKLLSVQALRYALPTTAFAKSEGKLMFDRKPK